MRLTPENVETVFARCLRNEGEAPLYRGVMLGAYLDVSEDRENIRLMLGDLPDPFQTEIGGGWSFLNMCVDRRDHQWTGLHQTQDKLVALGLASGHLRFCLEERDMWSMLPGGMPYIMVEGARA